MRRIFLKFLVVTTLFIFFSCSKEDEAGDENLIDLSITVMESGGAILEGRHKLTNFSETGFFVSKNPVPGQDNSEKVLASNGKEFSITLNEGLIFNHEYFVRAFVMTSDGTYTYSESKSFVSLGSKAPVIERIPQSHLNDTLTITGKYFKGEARSIRVKFDDVPGRLIANTDTTLTVIVPVELERYDPRVTVEVHEKKGIFPDFRLFQPVITGVSKPNVVLGDTLTLYGDHFDDSNDRNRILIEQVPIEILNSQRDSIQMVMPFDLSASGVDLELHSQQQVALFSGKIKVKKPVISSFPEEFRTYEIISIKGENFSPVREANRIYFDGNPGEIESASEKEIKVKVPIGPYKDHTPAVRIELMDYVVNLESDFTLTDHWLLKKEIPYNYFGSGSQHFVKDGIAYMAQKEYGEAYIQFLTFDSETEEMEKFEVVLPEFALSNYSFSVIYNEETKRIFFYFDSEKDNFYEFDISKRSFSKLGDYPGVASGTPAVFSINNRIYICLGSNFEGYPSQEKIESLSHLWSYNALTDEWDRKQDFPQVGRRWGLTVFIINDIAYLGNGANTTGHNDFWKYSAGTDTWEQIADFPNARRGTSYFAYQGKGYIYYGGAMTGNPDHTAFQYDVEKDKWFLLESLNDRYYTYFHYPEATFALKFSNKVYLAISRYPNLQFFEADLEKL